MNIYQSNSFLKDLNWLHFDGAPRVFRDATSKGPTHTIWCDIIILDAIIYLRKISDIYYIFKVKYEILLEFELDTLY